MACSLAHPPLTDEILLCRSIGNVPEVLTRMSMMLIELFEFFSWHPEFAVGAAAHDLFGKAAEVVCTDCEAGEAVLSH